MSTVELACIACGRPVPLDRQRYCTETCAIAMRHRRSQLRLATLIEQAGDARRAARMRLLSDRALERRRAQASKNGEGPP
jgi:hypothetical protein